MDELTGRLVSLRRLTCLGLLALAACGRPVPAAPAPAVSPKEAPVTTAQGPALSDSAALLAWFEGDGKGKRVRIPVVLTPDPLGLGPAFIGSTPGPAPEGAVHLKLDDTALSVGLADRMAPDCPFDVPCAIWVEGTWGAVVSGGPDLGGFGGPGIEGPGVGGAKQHPFAVRDYGGTVDGPATHVVVVGG